MGWITDIDSSTKRVSKLAAYGKSSAASTIHVGNHMIGAGVIYFSSNEPNKSVYDGILVALSQLESEHFNPAGTDTVHILADCQPDRRPSPYFVVHVEPTFGMRASFSCLRVEVVDAVPCNEVGKPIA